VNFRLRAAQKMNLCWQFSTQLLGRARRLVTKWATTTRTLSAMDEQKEADNKILQGKTEELVQKLI
jgi:hypothetical protein